MKYLFILLFSTILYAQEPHFFYFANKSWCSEDGNILKYDKVEHFVRDFALNGTLKFIVPEHSWKIALGFNFLWEVKDGFYADGFDHKDFLAGVGGIVISELIFRKILGKSK